MIIFRLFHRLGQSFRRVGRLRRVAEVELQLVRVFQIPLAAIAEGTLQKLVDRQFCSCTFWCNSVIARACSTIV